MTMFLEVQGASPAEIARGLAAAHAILAKTGVTPLQAAEALFKRDGWAALGYPDGGEPSPIEFAAADAFDVAEEAAIMACCAGWPQCLRTLTCGSFRTSPNRQGEGRAPASIFSSIKRRRPPTTKAMRMPSIACMRRCRFLVLIVQALQSGAFEWVLFESFDDVPGFEPLARSDLSFTTRESAWQAGCAALQSRMDDPPVILLDDQD